MLAVILCGGKSTRMGSDKGLLKLHANTWARTAADKMEQLNVQVVLSVNAAQFKDYAEVFDATQLIIDDAGLDIHGPLAGVLSIHEKYPAEDLFVFACDMPLMDISILEQLFENYQKHLTADAFAFTNEGAPEPLCAIYKATGLAHILELYRKSLLTKHSMKFMLEHINTQLTPLTTEQQKYFRNFNAHAELNGL
ncbi:MAG: molybdenum cofactor guanylyltransferase [Ferruginibacter sp.]